MRVLFVNTSMAPIPSNTGHQVHNWGNIQALQLIGHEVFLVMLSTYGEDIITKIEDANRASKNLQLCTAIEVPKQRNKSLNSLSPFLLFQEFTELLFKKESYFVQNHQLVCSELENLIESTEADLIWYEDFYVAVFDKWIKRKIPAVYNSHDNQAKLYKQKNLKNSTPSNRIGTRIRRLIYIYRWKVLEKSEIRAQRRCNVMFTGNSDDAVLSKSRGVNAILRRIPIMGANQEYLDKRELFINKSKVQRNSLKLLHLGTLQGGFTSRSLLWFLDHIWENLLEELNNYNIELHIVGSGIPSEELLKTFNQSNIIYRGYVDNLWEEFVDTFAMLIPGQISTGTRIRVPVAFSMMIPIIGNKVSFDGMPNAKNGETVLYAENAVEYSESIKRLKEETVFYKSICHNVRHVYDENFSIKATSLDIQREISKLY
jgi:hypothetical protein